MSEDEKQKTVQELMRQIQDKAIELADLEVILEDYERERREILREIGRLKASLWELSGTPPQLRSESVEASAQVTDQ